MPQQLVDILETTDAIRVCDETDGDDNSCTAQQDVEEDVKVDNILDLIFKDDAEDE